MNKYKEPEFTKEMENEEWLKSLGIEGIEEVYLIYKTEIDKELYWFTKENGYNLPLRLLYFNLYFFLKREIELEYLIKSIGLDKTNNLEKINILRKVIFELRIRYISKDIHNSVEELLFG